MQVFHLSEASETKNPVVAYEDRTLGEIDAESIIFFEEDESPSGVPAILFAGAFSTTISYWEFDCGEVVTVTAPSEQGSLLDKAGALLDTVEALVDSVEPVEELVDLVDTAPEPSQPSESLEEPDPSSAYMASGSLAAVAAVYVACTAM